MDVPRNLVAKATPAPPMDVVRKKSGKSGRKIRRAVYAVAAAGLLTLATAGLSRLKAAAPTVARSAVWTDTTKRGQMLRQVRGLGALVPEQIRQVAAPVEGLVERINAKPGERVSAGTVLVELSNPTLKQAAVDVEYQIKSAEAELNNLRARLESERMTQQAATAQVEAEYNQAKIQLDTDEQLGKEGLVPAITIRISRVRVEQLRNRLDIERERAGSNKLSVSAQLASQQARIEQLRAQLQLNREQVASLQVRAGSDGVLQQVAVEVGQQITPGTNIARMADPTTLKAVIQIAETQAKDILLGQSVSIDTRGGGVIPGRVIRIDPAVQNGTVPVDVQLEGALPPGARPDLSVDGTVELERLDNVLHIGRPANGSAQSTVSLFKLEEGGRSAVRVQVRFGRTSVNTVEVLEGLSEGDSVILSDTSQWDNQDRVLLQ
jgi:HlyD family secretion protein